MLQRKQSLWMLLAAACAVLTLKFPFSTGGMIDPAQGKIIGSVTASSNIGLLILTAALAISILINIFNYRNRKRQLQQTAVLIFLSLLQIFGLYRQTTTLIEGTYALTAIIALIIPVALIFAARGIFKDQKLIKSADRLR